MSGQDRTESLDEAWREAEAALPEGWWLSSLTEAGRSSGEAILWVAEAKAPFDPDRDWHILPAAGRTKVSALHALTLKLREVPR